MASLPSIELIVVGRAVCYKCQACVCVCLLQDRSLKGRTLGEEE